MHARLAEYLEAKPSSEMSTMQPEVIMLVVKRVLCKGALTLRPRRAFLQPRDQDLMNFVSLDQSVQEFGRHLDVITSSRGGGGRRR